MYLNTNLQRNQMAKTHHFLLATICLMAYSFVQAGEEAREFLPHSSVSTPQDAGVNARTHFKILIPPGGYVSLNNEINLRPSLAPSPKVASGSPPYLSAYETPASLACNYNITTAVSGCSPANYSSMANPTGGSRAIALVDAYHYANAASDLSKFSTQFGLPAPTLQVVYASGTKPASDPLGWEVEAALDLQWAHAMAPNAKLYLVEAKSNSIADLLLAVDKATALVAAAGGGEVSMSWGSAESSSEASYDSHFNNAVNKVVYFASSGDSAGTSWPCVSSNVVCVGGTTMRRNPSSGNLVAEVGWSDGGGGVSAYIAKPGYQSAIPGVSNRSVPDVASAADPRTGGWIYYTASNLSFMGWMIVGGTSWAAPSFAAIVNQSGTFLASSNAELTTIYANSSSYRDINSGWCSYYGGVSATAGWDACTGLGVNNTRVSGK